jgi:hypothetical protein
MVGGGHHQRHVHALGDQPVDLVEHLADALRLIRVDQQVCVFDEDDAAPVEPGQLDGEHPVVDAGRTKMKVTSLPVPRCSWQRFRGQQRHQRLADTVGCHARMVTLLPSWLRSRNACV